MAMPVPTACPRRASLSRRLLLAAGAGLLARPAHAETDGERAVAKVLAGRTPIEGAGLKLDIPSIAENGLVVPLTVEADSPMTAADHIRTITIIAADNPNPLVATFHFTPDSGRASASTRIRLAQTQDVVAIAETSGGALHLVRSEVKVTIGGCGG